jgi:hypothetical protein
MSLAVLGATSVIGIEVAKVFAQAGHDLLLVSRDTNTRDLQTIKKSHTTTAHLLDANISSVGNIEIIAEKIIESFDEDPYVLISVGALSGASEAGSPIADLLEVIDVNFRHIAAVLTLISAEFEQRKRGCIIVLTSVAGDRGRQSNYIYGSAKAGISTFAQGLRNRLFHMGVHVLTVKLGYVDTPMFRKALGEHSKRIPRSLVGDRKKVANSIYRAAIKRRNVLYRGRIWWLIMLVIRVLPETVFKRMHL